MQPEYHKNEQIQTFLLAAKKELTIRRYSLKTVKNYLLCLEKYFDFLEQKGRELKDADEKIVKEFLLEKLNGCAGSTINLYLSAIKFFYHKVLYITFDFNMKFVRKRKRIPVVLTKNEIFQCIDALSNKKHKLIIGLAYGSGLRVSEVVNLKIRDLDFEKGLIYVRKSKGNRDRVTLLPRNLYQNIYRIIDLRRLELNDVRNTNDKFVSGFF